MEYFVTVQEAEELVRAGQVGALYSRLRQVERRRGNVVSGGGGYSGEADRAFHLKEEERAWSIYREATKGA